MTEVSNRKVQFSTTVFLHHGDDYLFLRRNANKRVDPGRLNGIGGRVEPKENYVDAAVREAKEETGYRIKPENMELVAVGKLEGGYPEDWIMCFFKAPVGSKEIPNGSKTDDGELIWLNKDKVLDSEYELVDDLNYCFKDIVQGGGIIFFNAQVNSSEKISEISINKLRHE